MTELASDSERLERLEGDDDSWPGVAVGVDLELLPAGMGVPREVDGFGEADSGCDPLIPPGMDDCPPEDDGMLVDTVPGADSDELC
jgi:hypothetical protein